MVVLRESQLCDVSHLCLSKLQELAISETKAHRDIQNIRQEQEVQVASLRSKASALEADLARQTTTNRLLETECASLKTRLAMAAEDLETSLSANNALEKSVEMEKQAQNRMENALKEEVGVFVKRLVCL